MNFRSNYSFSQGKGDLSRLLPTVPIHCQRKQFFICYSWLYLPASGNFICCKIFFLCSPPLSKIFSFHQVRSCINPDPQEKDIKVFFFNFVFFPQYPQSLHQIRSCIKIVLIIQWEQEIIFLYIPEGKSD